MTPQLIDLPSCRINLVDEGPRDAPQTLLLIHGGHGGWQHWEINLPVLARTHRVVAVDMPGFGLSGDLPDPGVEAIAGAISQLIDALRLEHVTIVGFSFGSLVTVATALSRPDKIDRVMVINPPGLGPRSPESAALRAEVSAANHRDGMRAGLRVTMGRLMLSDTALLTDELMDTAETLAKQMRFYTRDVSRQADLLGPISRLQQPLRVLLGDQDPHQRHDLAGRAARVKEAKGGVDCTTIVPGGAHWLQRDLPKIFERELLAFAAR